MASKTVALDRQEHFLEHHVFAILKRLQLLPRHISQRDFKQFAVNLRRSLDEMKLHLETLAANGLPPTNKAQRVVAIINQIEAALVRSAPWRASAARCVGGRRI